VTLDDHHRILIASGAYADPFRVHPQMRVPDRVPRDPMRVAQPPSSSDHPTTARDPSASDPQVGLLTTQGQNS